MLNNSALDPWLPLDVPRDILYDGARVAALLDLRQIIGARTPYEFHGTRRDAAEMGMPSMGYNLLLCRYHIILVHAILMFLFYHIVKLYYIIVYYIVV